LIRHLNGGDAFAAHDVLRAASGGEQPVRLDAARKVGDYDEPVFEPFVAQWQASEKDPQVLAVLGAHSTPGEVPGWSPRQATGAPDADPTRDDPKAWASKNPEMGRQWLQLTYATPVRAHAVRIFEVNAPGAVAEVRARGADGGWVTLWQGRTNGGSSPLVVSFPLTSFAVRTVRIVLDTDRTLGWNEIDAVELVGPGGGQWAHRATASSTFANANDVGRAGLASDELSSEVFRYQKAVKTRR
jgi:hypothetical protein